jgi:hypothetical protein
MLGSPFSLSLTVRLVPLDQLILGRGLRREIGPAEMTNERKPTGLSATFTESVTV